MSLLYDSQRNTIVAVKTNLTQQQKEHIWQLMYEKIAGIILPKDQRYLEQQLQENENMQEAYEELESALKEDFGKDIANNFERFQNDEVWSDLFQTIKINRKTRPPFIIRFEKVAVAATVALIVISSGSYYFLSQRKTSAPPQQLAVATVPDGRSVLLQLANNRTIPLSEKPDQINLGDVQLRNANHALSFTSKGGVTVNGEQHTLIVPAGKDYKITLSDGSEIWLNAATRLQFPFNFNGNNREITLLSGEAYVKVAANVAQPFIVHTPTSTVRVLGTAFNINTYDAGTVRLSLVSGAVSMHAGTAAVVVKPGMEAIYTIDKGLYTQPFDAREVLSWREGKHYFLNTSLPEICTIMSRTLGITTVIDSGSLLHTKHFSGMLNKNKPKEEFLQSLENAVDIDYYFDKQGVLHFR